MSDLPTYPEEAAQREEAQIPEEAGRQLAGWWARVGAYILDTIITIIAIVGIVFLAALPAIVLPDTLAAIILIIAVVAAIAFPFWYFTYLTGNERGQTIGKRALGIRVRSDSAGGPIGYGRAFGRYGIQVVFGFFFIPWVLDYLWPLWDAKNQTLHDKIVGSVVERV